MQSAHDGREAGAVAATHGRSHAEADAAVVNFKPFRHVVRRPAWQAGRNPGGRKLPPARRIRDPCIIATDGLAPPGAKRIFAVRTRRAEAVPHDCNMCSRDVDHAGSKLMRRRVPVARAMRSSVRVDG